MQSRKRKRVKERESQRREEGVKYSRCPHHNPKTKSELWFAIVPHFSFVSPFYFVHPAKKMTQERINWHFLFFPFLPSSLAGTVLLF